MCMTSVHRAYDSSYALPPVRISVRSCCRRGERPICERARMSVEKVVTRGTAAQRTLLARQSDDMIDLQNQLYVAWLQNSLPMEWDKPETQDPVEPHRTRVTLRLDSDMVKWFRKLGPGYQARINQILRIYWRGVMLGQVEAHYDPAIYARMIADHTPRGR